MTVVSGGTETMIKKKSKNKDDRKGKVDDLSPQARALKKQELLQKIARKKAKKKENLKPDTLDAEGDHIVGSGPLVVAEDVSRMADIVARQANKGLAIPWTDSAHEESGSGEDGEGHAARVLDFGPARGKPARRKAEKTRDPAETLDTDAAASGADKKKKHKKKRKRADVRFLEREAEEEPPHSCVERQDGPPRKDGAAGPSAVAGNKAKKQRLREADTGGGENNGAEAAAAEAAAEGPAEASAPPVSIGGRGRAAAGRQELQPAKGAPKKGLKSAAADADARGSVPETTKPGAVSHAAGPSQGIRLNDILTQLTGAKKPALAGDPAYGAEHDATQSLPVRKSPQASTMPVQSAAAASTPAPAPTAKRPRGRPRDPNSKAGLLRQKRALKEAAKVQAEAQTPSRRVKLALLSDEDDDDAGEGLGSPAVAGSLTGDWCQPRAADRSLPEEAHPRPLPAQNENKAGATPERPMWRRKRSVPAAQKAQERGAAAPGIASQAARRSSAPRVAPQEEEELDAPEANAAVAGPAAGLGGATGAAVAPQVNTRESQQEEVRVPEAEIPGTPVLPASSPGTPSAVASPVNGNAGRTPPQAGAPVMPSPTSAPAEAALTDKQLDDDLETAQTALLASLLKQRKDSAWQADKDQPPSEENIRAALHDVLRTVRFESATRRTVRPAVIRHIGYTQEELDAMAVNVKHVIKAEFKRIRLCTTHIRNLLKLKCVRRLRQFEKRAVVAAEAAAVLAAFPAVGYDAQQLQELCTTPGATLSTCMQRVVDRATTIATATAKGSHLPIAPPLAGVAPNTLDGTAVEDEEPEADSQDTEIEDQETEVDDEQAGAKGDQTEAEDEQPETGRQKTQSTQPQQVDGVAAPSAVAAPVAAAGLAAAGPPSPLGSIVPETQSAENGAGSDLQAPPQPPRSGPALLPVCTAGVPLDAGRAPVSDAELAAAPDASSAPIPGAKSVPAQDCGPAPVPAPASAPISDGGQSPVPQAGWAAPLGDDGSSPPQAAGPSGGYDLPHPRTAIQPQEQLRPKKRQESAPPHVGRNVSGQALFHKSHVSANAKAAAAARSGMPWRARRGRPPGTRRASVGERAKHTPQRPTSTRPSAPLGPLAEQCAVAPTRFPHTHPIIRQWCKLGLLLDAPGCSERRVVRRLRMLRAAATMEDEGALRRMDEWHSSSSGSGPVSVAGLRQTRQTRQQREADMLAVVSREIRGLPGGRSPACTSRAHTSDAADALAMLAEQHGEGSDFTSSPRRADGTTAPLTFAPHSANQPHIATATDMTRQKSLRMSSCLHLPSSTTATPALSPSPSVRAAPVEQVAAEPRDAPVAMAAPVATASPVRVEVQLSLKALQRHTPPTAAEGWPGTDIRNPRLSEMSMRDLARHGPPTSAAAIGLGGNGRPCSTAGDKATEAAAGADAGTETAAPDSRRGATRQTGRVRTRLLSGRAITHGGGGGSLRRGRSSSAEAAGGIGVDAGVDAGPSTGGGGAHGGRRDGVEVGITPPALAPAVPPEPPSAAPQPEQLTPDYPPPPAAALSAPQPAAHAAVPDSSAAPSGTRTATALPQYPASDHAYPQHPSPTMPMPTIDGDTAAAAQPDPDAAAYAAAVPAAFSDPSAPLVHALVPGLPAHSARLHALPAQALPPLPHIVSAPARFSDAYPPSSQVLAPSQCGTTDPHAVAKFIPRRAIFSLVSAIRLVQQTAGQAVGRHASRPLHSTQHICTTPSTVTHPLPFRSAAAGRIRAAMFGMHAAATATTMVASRAEPSQCCAITSGVAECAGSVAGPSWRGAAAPGSVSPLLDSDCTPSAAVEVDDEVCNLLAPLARLVEDPPDSTAEALHAVAAALDAAASSPSPQRDTCPSAARPAPANGAVSDAAHVSAGSPADLGACAVSLAMRATAFCVRQPQARSLLAQWLQEMLEGGVLAGGEGAPGLGAATSDIIRGGQGPAMHYPAAAAGEVLACIANVLESDSRQALKTAMRLTRRGGDQLAI